MRSKYQRELPGYYYHDHFKEVINSLRGHYSKILGDVHHQWIAEFESQSFEVQCLYLRMVNRKGKFFRKSKLVYADIPNSDVVLESLLEKRYARKIDYSDFPPLWQSLTKTELVAFCKDQAFQQIKTSWNKPKIVEQLISSHCHEQAGDFYCEEFVALEQDHFIEYFLFLYSGKLQNRFDAFTLRDLGIVGVNDREISNRFDSQEEAEECYFYQSALNRIQTDIDIEAVTESILIQPKPASSYGIELRSKALFKAGRKLERLDHLELAISAYEQSQYPHSKERLARISYKQGDKNASQALLESIIEDPNSDEDYYFAVDFYQRKFGASKQSYATKILADSKSMSLDEAYLKSPERGVIDSYRSKGYVAFHGENGFWLALFGIVFWDEIEADKHSAFDGLPQSLKLNTFRANHEAAINAKLRLVHEGQGEQIIRSCVDQNFGKPNSFIRWNKLNADLFARVANSHATSIAKLLDALATSFSNMKDGYPDVLAIKDDQLKLIEVKAEGDVVRKNQLIRINQLKEYGFDVEIIRANYQYRPEQIYTVVDIETTGGRKNHHKITEIGAVKVQNGEIIDSWQTLINPEKRIPNNITRLTGITNEMVASAPKFAAIADELQNFLDGSVFVAHNANFDYGFISEEFRTLGRRFRMPKFCTVVGMRRYYKGLRSYSLGNLTKHFDIELHNHHRAMDDARATVELLKLINLKRAKASVSVD